MKRKLFDFLNFFILFTVLTAVWWFLYLLKIWPSWVLPSPWSVFAKIFSGLADFSLVSGMFISLGRVIFGFSLSFIFGTLIGFLISKNIWLKTYFKPLILGLQTLPSICWLPLALLWFGLNEKAIIFVVIMGTVLSVTISVESAIANISSNYIKAGLILGANKINLYKYIIFPAILPSYINAARQGWSFAWRSLMSGEMLFITVGLGQLLMFGRELNDMSQVMAVMIVIIIVGAFFDQAIFAGIEKRIRLKWGLTNR
ncbi:MAG TPA: ABC transporter permease [Candidatus Magasanikbacteria bacterium]|nr:ABC transporter permease [Candidatus Magasanikbacteria bacterium]